MELRNLAVSNVCLENEKTLSQLEPKELSLKLLGDLFTETDISFIDDELFVGLIPDNMSIYILCNKKMHTYLVGLFPKIKFIVVSDPRLTFYKLHNAKSELNAKSQNMSIVSKSARIHHTAQISKYGVQIGANCIIEEFASIKPGTILGDNCVIQAGSRLGDSGFEFKRTSEGILAIAHDGGLILGQNVQIGANSTLGRGFLSMDTTIGDDTKIDFGVSIAHRSTIGDRVFIAAGVVVSGSTFIGSDTWIGPSAVISNGLMIGENSHIALGSVVVKSFPANSWLMGVPARNIPKN
jgi:UDP-3-O-[3-hydroxymyristoyl] glucosamine N-acyltransferase